MKSQFPTITDSAQRRSRTKQDAKSTPADTSHYPVCSAIRTRPSNTDRRTRRSRRSINPNTPRESESSRAAIAQPFPERTTQDGNNTVGRSGSTNDGSSRHANTGTGGMPNTRSYGGLTRKREGCSLGEVSNSPSLVCFPMCSPRATAARTIFVGRSPNAASVPGGSCEFFCDAACVVCSPIEKRSVNDKTRSERAIRISL